MLAAEIATVSQPRCAACARSRPPAMIRPMATGTRASCASLKPFEPATRLIRRPTTNASRQAGSSIESVATSRPARPPICQPIRLTMTTLGPGVIWVTAYSCMKVASLIQCRTSTTSWRIAGTTALTPPIAISEIIAKLRASAPRMARLVISCPARQSVPAPPVPSATPRAPVASGNRQ